MKYLSLTICLTIAAGSFAVARADDCGPRSGSRQAGCGAEKACGVCEQPCGVCRPVAKCEPVKKTCYEVECKTICIPAVTLPWQDGPLAGLARLLSGGKCGASSCGRCGASCSANGPCGACGPGGGGVNASDCKNGFCSNICGEVRAVRILKKSSKPNGEKLVCEWKHDPNSTCGTDGRHCGARKPGCCSDGVAPPASAPVTPVGPAVPRAVPVEAAPETARQRLPGYGMRSSLLDVLTVSLD